MTETLTRRKFLGGSVAAVGALAAALFPRRAAATQPGLPVYALDPEWGSCGLPEASKPLSCHACSACHSHARNKLFASVAAANGHRAHLHCKCLVVGHGTLPLLAWVLLFGNPRRPRRTVVDRRWRWVSVILSHISR